MAHDPAYHYVKRISLTYDHDQKCVVKLNYLNLKQI